MAQHKVLILDDSPLVLELLRASLEANGIRTDTASTLAELEAKRAESPPDAILLDVQMPEAWGDDVAATLRAVYGVSVPILLMSTLPPEELDRRAADAGVMWVSKRDGIGAILRRVEQVLSMPGHG